MSAQQRDKIERRVVVAKSNGELDLTGLALLSMPKAAAIPDLKFLDMNKNKLTGSYMLFLFLTITDLPQELLAAFSETLDQLNLTNNNFAEVPQALIQLRALQGMAVCLFLW